MESRYWFQAKGLDYQDYKDRPTYRAHCVTAHVAATILRESGGSNSDAHKQFRMLAPFRSPQANELRAKVAARARLVRASLRRRRLLLEKASSEDHLNAYLLAHQQASRALARGDIRAFSVISCPDRGRVIYYETHQGWNPEPAFCDFYPEDDRDLNSSSAW